MTSAIGNPEGAAAPRVAALNRPNIVSVGTIVFLSQELMFFAGLFAMYFTSRANGIGNGSWKEGAAHLNVPYAMVITAILISSSVTAQFGVFAAERGRCAAWSVSSCASAAALRSSGRMSRVARSQRSTRMVLVDANGMGSFDQCR